MNLPLDADLAGTDVLLEVVAEIQIGSVSWEVADENHLVGVLIL